MKKVTILMSTYNGEKFLQEQLDSLYAQKGVKVSILVRDDGSTDSTISILDKNAKLGLLLWYSGKNKKSALSFLDLIMKAPESDYYAFCDQDDIWSENKLIRAIDLLEGNEVPSLYYCGAILIDSANNYIGSLTPMLIPDRFKGLSYGQSVLGCTMVINYKLMKVIKEIHPKRILMHDAWISHVCQIIHGKIICDNNKYVFYRQHNNNVIGGKKDIYSIIKRKIKFIQNNKGTYSVHWNELYINLYDKTDEKTRHILYKLSHYKKSYNRIKILTDKEILWGNNFFRTIYYDLMFLFGLF